jgi:hypothetical protein
MTQVKKTWAVSVGDQPKAKTPDDVCAETTPTSCTEK